ncbi:MAG TPA: biotin/lipoyl-binding protein, partial [Terriglobales bacterium]|nr:biotin/lipoyl-binding protein [Terriglobales bacterium]
MNGNGNNKKKRRKRIIIISSVVGVILLFAIVLSAFTRGGTKIDPTKLAKVEKGDLAKSVVATGKVTPIVKVEVKSKASGIVKKLYVEYGDKVKQGQLLAQLDKVEIEAQVEQSKAALEAADANLNSSQADYERAKVDAEGPDVPMNKRAYERAQSMAKDGVVSASALDDAQKNYDMSVNKQNVAKAQVTVLKAKIAQAQAQVAQDRANLKQLEEQLSYTDI